MKLLLLIILDKWGIEKILVMDYVCPGYHKRDFSIYTINKTGMKYVNFSLFLVVFLYCSTTSFYSIYFLFIDILRLLLLLLCLLFLLRLRLPLLAFSLESISTTCPNRTTKSGETILVLATVITLRNNT